MQVVGKLGTKVCVVHCVESLVETIVCRSLSPHMKCVVSSTVLPRLCLISRSQVALLA